MFCIRCGGNNVNVQVTNQVQLKNKKRGLLYWIIIGWWLEICLWIWFTIPRLLIALFMPKRQKIVNKTVTTAVCQSCGHSWEVK